MSSTAIVFLGLGAVVLMIVIASLSRRSGRGKDDGEAGFFAEGGYDGEGGDSGGDGGGGNGGGD